MSSYYHSVAEIKIAYTEKELRRIKRSYNKTFPGNKMKSESEVIDYLRKEDEYRNVESIEKIHNKLSASKKTRRELVKKENEIGPNPEDLGDKKRDDIEMKDVNEKNMDEIQENKANTNEIINSRTNLPTDTPIETSSTVTLNDPLNVGWDEPWTRNVTPTKTVTLQDFSINSQETSDFKYIRSFKTPKTQGIFSRLASYFRSGSGKSTYENLNTALLSKSDSDSTSSYEVLTNRQTQIQQQQENTLSVSTEEEEDDIEVLDEGGADVADVLGNAAGSIGTFVPWLGIGLITAGLGLSIYETIKKEFEGKKKVKKPPPVVNPTQPDAMSGMLTLFDPSVSSMIDSRYEARVQDLANQEKNETKFMGDYDTPFGQFFKEDSKFRQQKWLPEIDETENIPDQFESQKKKKKFNDVDDKERMSKYEMRTHGYQFLGQALSDFDVNVNLGTCINFFHFFIFYFSFFFSFLKKYVFYSICKS